MIGQNLDLIRPGEVLSIPPIVVSLTCKITATDGLHARALPNTQSSLLHTFPQGTVLTFFEVVMGETVVRMHTGGTPIRGITAGSAHLTTLMANACGLLHQACRHGTPETHGHTEFVSTTRHASGERRSKRIWRRMSDFSSGGPKNAPPVDGL